MLIKKTAGFIGFLLFFACVNLFSQTINVSGAPWNVNITPPSQAGENPIDNIESLADQIEIDIHGQKDNNWQVTVEKDGTSWHSNLTLQVKRTGEGNGNGPFAGGTDYVTIPDSPTLSLFFWGGKNRTNVPCQYRLHSDNLCPETSYSALVIYTVTSTP